MDGVNEQDENGKVSNLLDPDAKKKPLDESRNTGQTSGTEVTSYSYMNYVGCLVGGLLRKEAGKNKHEFTTMGLLGKYNTFSGYPPDMVKRLPKKDLTEEVWRLQAALNEQTEITKSSQQNCERLQNDKILCRICFEREINTVLLPCRHHVLCSICSEKCQKCPICRVVIEERLPVYDV